MYQLANNVLGTLKYDITGADVAFVVQPLPGVPPFNVPPAPTDQAATFGAPYGIVTLMDRLDSSCAKIEHILYSGRAAEAGGAYTYTTSAALRGAEGSGAQAWVAGAYVVQIATVDVLAMNTARAVQRSAALLTHKSSIDMSWDGASFGFDTFVVHGAGRGKHWASDGYFTITMPANGTTVHGHGGTPDVPVAAAAIPIAAKSALYFEPKISGANASVAGNFHLVGETADFVVPAHWILLAVHSEVLAGEKVLRVATGVTMTPGSGAAGITGTQEAVLRSEWTLVHKRDAAITWDGVNFNFNRFRAGLVGRGAQWGTAGYFDLTMPAVATVVTGHGGAANQNVVAGGIPVPENTSLWYAPPIGAGSASVDANWHLVGTGADYAPSTAWILVAAHIVTAAGEKSLRVANGATYYAERSVAGEALFQNGWVDFGGAYRTAGFAKDGNGWVKVFGMIKSGALNTTAFVLPAGYRPGGSDIFPAWCGNAFGWVQVDANGSVTPNGPSNASLDLSAIFYRAAA